MITREELWTCHEALMWVHFDAYMSDTEGKHSPDPKECVSCGPAMKILEKRIAEMGEQ